MVACKNKNEPIFDDEYIDDVTGQNDVISSRNFYYSSARLWRDLFKKTIFVGMR